MASVAADIGKMDGATEAARARVVNGVAGLVRDFRDGKAPSAVPKHLGHERHALEHAAPVERSEDLVSATHFNDVTRSQ
jgi:hypothetical protein